MQTFQVTLKIDTRAVVPEQFLQEARKEAMAEDATPFLKAVQKLYPEDDDQFMLAIVKNAFRAQVRTNLLTFMARSGVGGSVSPVQVIDEIITQPKAEALNEIHGDACKGPDCPVVGGGKTEEHSTACQAQLEEAANPVKEQP